MTREKYESLPLSTLKALAKSRNMKGISTLRKEALIERMLEEDQKEKVLLKCIESLPEKQRISIYRFFMEDRSYKEIEEATGFSLKMIKSFIQNGKRNLKLCMQKKGVIA